MKSTSKMGLNSLQILTFSFHNQKIICDRDGSLFLSTTSFFPLQKQNSSDTQIYTYTQMHIYTQEL